jgi:hypothetical protein
MHTSRRTRLVLLGALSACAVAVLSPVAAPALAGPTVTVRIEGESSTLLPATLVTLNAPEPVSGCPANSVAAAINLAVGGNWDHGEANSGGGDFTETILGETHDFTHESDAWAEWVNYKWGGGICTDLLSEGDEVLMVADHQPPPWYAPTVLPLVVTEAPTVVEAGVPFTVKVSAIHTPPEAFAELGQGSPEPAAGVTVSAAGASATTDANGVASLTVASAGQVTVRATKAGDAPSRTFPICVHEGNDGNCGTTAATPGAPVVPAAVILKPYTGPYALVASVAGLIEGHVYKHHSAPRLLTGTIRAHSAVTSVSLELHRRYRGRCSAYDGTSEHFRRARCGHGSFFQVSSGGTFSYLLPAALAPGRYVLDVKATDVAGNEVALARGSSRIVFYVR